MDDETSAVETVLKAVLQILRKCSTLEEAIEAVEKLIDKDKR